MMMLSAFALAGCGGGDEEEGDTDGSGDTGGSGGSTANAAPSISGTPSPQVVQESQYAFTPTASDSDSDSLTFSVANLPAWATFSASNGQISGTPTSADLGSYQGITISVSDGEHTVSLGPFTIDVVAVGSASATLNWTAPTTRTDGSPLSDLAGYRIYYGTSVGNYTKSVTIDNPGVTTYVVEGLVPATYYFVATAYDSGGLESRFSNVASKTVN